MKKEKHILFLRKIIFLKSFFQQKKIFKKCENKIFSVFIRKIKGFYVEVFGKLKKNEKKNVKGRS